MRFISEVVEKMKRHILCSITFFPENHTVYGIMWQNIVEPDTPQMSVWRMRISCWISKATTAHSGYAIVISSPPQQQLHKRASYCLSFLNRVLHGRYKAVKFSASVCEFHLTLSLPN
jgi:hypothetical protein